MYTVKQWIEILKDFPEDVVVIVSSDSEGNYFSPLSNGIGQGFYHINTGEWITEKDDVENIAADELRKAIFLFPTD